MDPISISASLVALIGAANTTVQGVRKLLRLRGAPVIILALNNEISDIQLLLNEANVLIQQARSLHTEDVDKSENQTAGLRSLSPTLGHIQQKLTSLNAILERFPTNGLNFANKVLWLRAETRVLKIHGELGSLKQSLSTALGLLTSTTALRVHIELQDLRVTTTNGHSNISQAITEKNSSLEQSLTTIAKSRNENERSLEKMEQSLLELSEQFRQQQIEPVKSHMENLVAKDLNLNRGMMNETTAFGALQMKFSQRQRCQPWCRCTCHAERKLSTPRILNTVFGMLYAGYAGVPALSPSCNSSICKGNSEGLLQVHYFFPPWFLSKVASMALGVSRVYGPELCFRMTNVRADWEPIFKQCYFGDVEAVKSTLVAGRASILDVKAETGHSLLHTAMFKAQLDVVELLIQFGAEPHRENQIGEQVLLVSK